MPLDIDTILNSVEKTGRLIITHEACTRFGVGAEIAAEVCERGLYFLEKPVKRVGAPHVPMPFAPEMENFVVPNTAGLVRAVKELM